jgi:hypothetical protein
VNAQGVGPPLSPTLAVAVSFLIKNCSLKKCFFFFFGQFYIALWMTLTASSRTMFASNTTFSVVLTEASTVRLEECPMQRWRHG